MNQNSAKHCTYHKLDLQYWWSLTELFLAAYNNLTHHAFQKDLEELSLSFLQTFELLSITDNGGEHLCNTICFCAQLSTVTCLKGYVSFLWVMFEEFNNNPIRNDLPTHMCPVTNDSGNIVLQEGEGTQSVVATVMYSQYEFTTPTSVKLLRTLQIPFWFCCPYPPTVLHLQLWYCSLLHYSCFHQIPFIKFC